MVLLALFSVVLITSPALAQDNGNAAGFEIDDYGALLSGDGTVSGVASGDDWAEGAAGLGVLDDDGAAASGFVAMRWVDPNWGNDGHGHDPTQFGGGSNKIGDLIGVGQDPWTWNGVGGGPAKNDITNTYFHTRVASEEGTEHRWIFLGAETRSVNGDSSVLFEFNQAGIMQTGLASGELVGLGPDNGRTVGDFLIEISFRRGGREPVPAFLTWDGASYEAMASPEGVLAAVNLIDISHGDSGDWGHFDRHGADSDVLLALQLVEVAADLTALGLDLDVCNSDSTVTVITRASHAASAELKDFVRVAFPLHPLPVNEIVGPTTVCPGESGVVYSVQEVPPPAPPTAGDIAASLLRDRSVSTRMDANRDGALSAADVVASLDGVSEPHPGNGVVASTEITIAWSIEGDATFCGGAMTAEGASVCVDVDAMCGGGGYTVRAVTTSGFCSTETSLAVSVEADADPPAITCPASMQVGCGASVEVTVTATDGCDADPVITCDFGGDTQGYGVVQTGNGAYTVTFAASGEAVVTCTATDLCGNTSDPCSFEITAVCN